VITLAQAQFLFPGQAGRRGPSFPACPLPVVGRSGHDRGAYSIMGMGVHALDFLHSLLDRPITEVAAITDGQTAQKPLKTSPSLPSASAGGTVGTVCCGRRVPDTRNDAVIYGTSGRVWLKDTLYEP